MVRNSEIITNILDLNTEKTVILSEFASQNFLKIMLEPYYFTTPYLFAVVGGILHTNQVSIWPSIQICVLSTDMAVASVTGLALTAVHGISEVSEVVATGIFVAVVASIEAGITGCAHLERVSEQ